MEGVAVEVEVAAGGAGGDGDGGVEQEQEPEHRLAVEQGGHDVLLSGPGSCGRGRLPAVAGGRCRRLRYGSWQRRRGEEAPATPTASQVGPAARRAATGPASAPELSIVVAG